MVADGIIREPDPTKGDKPEPAFHGSETTSIGIEMEFPILDQESGELVPGAPRILPACAEEGLEGVGAELMQSMLEVRTGICADATKAREEVLPILQRVKNIAGSMGYNLAMFGTHPFLRLSTSAVYPTPRFESALAKLAFMTYYRVAFGLHIHVGVRSGDQAVGVMNTVMPYLPHLLAISANSPFWQGVDSGLSSCRSALYGLVPHAGVPPVFHKWREFRDYYRMMEQCDTLHSFKDIKWDLRPRPDLGTIEFRVCDMPGSLAGVFQLASLTRCMVMLAQRMLDEHPPMQKADRRRHYIAIENKWLASRYGLKANYIRSADGKRRPLADDLAELIERLMPVAREAGEDKLLSGLLPVTQIDSGAERQRQLYRQVGSWPPFITDCLNRFTQELEKLSTPRPAPAPV